MKDRAVSLKAVLKLVNDRIGNYYIAEAIKKLPNISQNTVSKATFEQVMWERDIAIQQLKELGYGFAEKLRTGYWEFKPYAVEFEDDAVCSICNKLVVGASEYKFCPNCGTKMEINK